MRSRWLGDVVDLFDFYLSDHHLDQKGCGDVVVVCQVSGHVWLQQGVECWSEVASHRVPAARVFRHQFNRNKP